VSGADAHLAALLAGAVVVALPLRRRFRGLDVREAVLVHGPRGWGEFAPFDDYSDRAAARWLGSAIEAAYGRWPTPVRDRIAVNAIVPAVGPADAAALTRAAVRGAGCRTAKVKVGGDLAADEERVAAVRAVLDDELGPGVGRLRVDANAAWSPDEAVRALRVLARYGLEYVEQPCATAGDLRRVRGRVDVPIAADESIRTATDPAAVRVREFADVAICKPAPLGGVEATLAVAEAVGVPVVVSGSLDSSVGLSVGLAAAAALADLPYACGLGTGALLAADVVTDTPTPVGGSLPVGRVDPDPAALAAASGRVSADRVARWHARLAAAWAAGSATAIGARWRDRVGP